MRVQQEVAISVPKPIAAIVPEHAAFTGRTAFTGTGRRGQLGVVELTHVGSGHWFNPLTGSSHSQLSHCSVLLVQVTARLYT